MLLQDELAVNAAGPTYHEAFASGSGVLDVVGWFGVVEVLALAAFVLLLPALRGLPDAGLGASKIVALVGLSAAMFVAVSWLGLVLDHRLVALLAATFLAAAAWRGWHQREVLHELWRERRAVLLVGEAVGVACFLAVVGVRALNPDLWHPVRGGEKPFELALLTAVLRTRTLPVYDPWFSGGSLNYYYGGWLLLSGPARLLRSSPTLVMNVGLAVFAWCSAGAAYSAGAALTTCWSGDGTTATPAMRSAIGAGALAAMFVLVLPNGAILQPLGERLTGGSADHPTGLDWWALSRVIPDSIAITEFPAWSFLFGDLHPHVMSIALLLALGSLLVAWHDAVVAHRFGHSLLLALLVGGVVGFVRMTNTWDFPLSLGLVGLTALIAVLSGVSWRALLPPLAVIVFVVVLAYWPYVRRGQVFDAGIEPTMLRTPPSGWVQQFGFFAVVAAAAIAAEVDAALDTARPLWGWVTWAHLAVGAGCALALGHLVLRPGSEVFLLTAVLAIGSVWVAWRRRHDPVRARPLGAFVLSIGWAVQAGVELVTVRNDPGRMNSVFKFWFQSWVLLAVGAAVILGAVLVARPALRRPAVAMLGAAGVLCVAFWALALPARLDDRITVGGPSLDGEAYLDARFVVGSGSERFAPADDRPLIEWLRRNVRGIQTVAEAPGIDYRWTGRISWSTGLPVPVGWSYHQMQQRRPYAAAVAGRTADLTALYTAADEREIARVLDRYGVAYVVYGTQEAMLATPASAAVLRSFACLQVVEQADRSTPEGPVADELFLAAVDQGCLNRVRPS